MDKDIGWESIFKVCTIMVGNLLNLSGNKEPWEVVKKKRVTTVNLKSFVGS